MIVRQFRAIPVGLLFCFLLGQQSQSTEQGSGTQSEAPSQFDFAETRLPTTIVANISVPSLHGLVIDLYADPDKQQKRYYMRPYLMPDWEILRNTIKEQCTNRDDKNIVHVDIPLEFARETVR